VGLQIALKEDTSGAFVLAGWRGDWRNSSSLQQNVRQYTANHYSCLVGPMFSEIVLSAIEW